LGKWCARTELGSHLKGMEERTLRGELLPSSSLGAGRVDRRWDKGTQGSDTQVSSQERSKKIFQVKEKGVLRSTTDVEVFPRTLLPSRGKRLSGRFS